MDYDCPEWKLDDYRVLLVSLRQSVAPVPLTFTALPVWLYQHRAFRKLIDAVDGYVLQVHSLQPPQSPDRADRPRRAAVGAGVGRKSGSVRTSLSASPLPTYSYQVAFDARASSSVSWLKGPFVTFGDGNHRPARPAAIPRPWPDWSAAGPRDTRRS